MQSTAPWHTRGHCLDFQAWPGNRFAWAQYGQEGFLHYDGPITACDAARTSKTLAKPPGRSSTRTGCSAHVLFGASRWSVQQHSAPTSLQVWPGSTLELLQYARSNEKQDGRGRFPDRLQHCGVRLRGWARNRRKASEGRKAGQEGQAWQLWYGSQYFLYCADLGLSFSFQWDGRALQYRAGVHCQRDGCLHHPHMHAARLKDHIMHDACDKTLAYGLHGQAMKSRHSTAVGWVGQPV